MREKDKGKSRLECVVVHFIVSAAVHVVVQSFLLLAKAKETFNVDRDLLDLATVPSNVFIILLFLCMLHVFKPSQTL